MSKLNGWNLVLSLVLAAAIAPLGWGQAQQDELSKQPPPKAPASSQSSPSEKPGAQAAASAKSSAQSSAEAGGAGIRAGTRIDAELESSLDARTAKPGDEVAARVVHNVKQHGRTIIRKGDQLLGRVTSVSAAANGSAKSGSAVNVAFDRLAQASSVTQLNAMVSAILSSPAAQPMNEPAAEQGPIGGPAPSRGGSRGGLLGGGLGSTVNSTVNSTVDTAGTVTRNAGGAVGAASNTTAGANANVGLATPIRAIHINSALSAENQTTAGSTLSTRHGNLRLESGTRLEFRVAGSTMGSKQ